MQQRERYYCALSVVIQLGFVCIVFQYLQFAQTPFFSYAVGGAFVILVATASRRMEWLLTFLLAPLFALAYSSLGGHFGSSIWSIPANVAGFLGLASLFVLGGKAAQKSDVLPPFLAAMSIPLFTVITGFVLILLMRIEPLVYDFYLYRFDSSLSVQVGAELAAWAHRFPTIEGGLWIGYLALPLVQSILLASHLRAGRLPIRFFLVTGLAGVLGCGLYYFLPVVGPAHVFGESFRILASRVVPAALTTPLHQTPRNGMPSLHFTWALLIFWNVLPNHRTGRALAAGFVLLTGLATLGLGEHYLVDLIVAVPFAFAVQSLGLGRRKNATVAGLISLAWMFYFRLGIRYLEPVPAVSWLASGITVFVPAILDRVANRPLSSLVRSSPALSPSGQCESRLH